MGQVTTHSEGRVVTTTTADDGVEVVQLPNRDGVETAVEPSAPLSAPVTVDTVKAPRPQLKPKPPTRKK